MFSRLQLILTLMLVMTAVVLQSCSQSKTKTAVQKKVVVQAAVVAPSSRAIVRTYTGSLQGTRQAVLRARLSEPVDSLLVGEGDSVVANQVLLVLDKYGPSSRYPENLSLFRNAEKQYRKMKYLYEQGAVSETQFDAAKTDYEVKKASLDAVERLVQVRTPIAGIVTSITVEEGDQVIMGQELATVATTDSLRVKFGVNDREVGAFRKGGDVIVHSQVSTATADGKITSVAGSADPVTRTFEIEAVFDNAKGLFQPGQFVRIDHVERRLTDALIVPSDAVVELAGQPTLYVVTDGIARRRQVKLGANLDGSAVIEAGLSAGDTLVVLGQEYLKDSVPVNITSLREVAP